MTVPATPTIPATPADVASTAGYIPAPLVATIVSVLFLAGLLADVLGKWRGPVTQTRERRERRVATSADSTTPAQVSPEVRALQSAMQALEKARARDAAEIQRLIARATEQDRTINGLRADQAASNRVLAAHTRWDRAAQQALASAGIPIDPPPPVYVIEEAP